MVDPSSKSGVSVQIILAEDNQVSRALMAGILKAKGYDVLEAPDGRAAIRLLSECQPDLAIVDQMMAPMGGFDFAQYLTRSGIDLPVIMVTAHDSSDILIEAGKYGIRQVLHKPVDPERLGQSVARVLRQIGINPAPLAVDVRKTTYSPEELLARAIALAKSNVRTGKGAPFGAVIADPQGHIVGEGVSGRAGRADPTAHAEVLAIRRATERLGQPHLEGHILYCSSEPTDIGKSLIASVGLAHVVYALSRQDLAARGIVSRAPAKVPYEHVFHPDAQDDFFKA